MDSTAFLARLWPTEGVLFIATPAPSGHGYIHTPCSTPAQAASYAARFDAEGRDVFFALSSFHAAKVDNPNWTEGSTVARYRYRVGENAKLTRAFWLDLDVDPVKEGRYPSQSEAAVALKAFVTITGLPVPMVVSSGYGLHAYWPLAEAVPCDQWQTAADQLKALTLRLGLKADQSRTSDRTSVLRVPGTHNYKHGAVKLVNLLVDGGITSFDAFTRILTTNGCAPKEAKQHAPQYAEFDDLEPNLVKREFAPSFEAGIVLGCAQFSHLKETGGNVAQPYWYAGLQLLRHVEGGEALKYAYSDGHPGFSEEETDTKWQQLADKNIGPTSCGHFKDVNPTGCDGCVHVGKLKSPIQLGRDAPAEAQPEPVSEPVKFAPTGVQPIPPYARTAEGVVILDPTAHNDDGTPVRTIIYPNDLYGVCQIADEQQGHCTVFEYVLPHQQPKQFIFPNSAQHDKKEISNRLGHEGIVIPTHLIAKVTNYMIMYINEIQKFAAAQKHYAQMGWHADDTCFISGINEYHNDGSVKAVGVSGAISQSTKSLHAKGDLAVWKEVFNTYAKPGFEPYAFAALTAFGAPIFKFTGHEGVLLNMVGETGSGKTTVLRVINSVYGHPKGVTMNKGDTPMSFQRRMGVYNNLPIVLDEVTNIEADELSTICYGITAGRGRHRLKPDGTERENLTSWQTIVASTSNTNLSDVLAAYKSNSSPEAMRLFEYTINQKNLLTKAEAMQRFPLLDDNYGMAGHLYLRYITKHLGQIKKLLAEHTGVFDTRAEAPTRERYWSALVVSNYIGGCLAKELGLHDYDMNRLWDWAVDMVRAMRRTVAGNVTDPISTLSGFLNRSHMNTLFVTFDPVAKTYKERDLPLRELHIRVDRQEDKVPYHDEAGLPKTRSKTRTLIYMSQNEFHNHCVRNKADYSTVKAYLKEHNVVLDTGKRYSLGKGTHLQELSGQTVCWIINGDHEMMGGANIREVPKPVDIKLEDDAGRASNLS